MERAGLSVELERQIAASPAAIWAVIATTEGMASWLGSRTFEPWLEGRVLFDVTHDGQRWLMFGRVLELVAEQRIAFTWQEFDTSSLAVWPEPTLVTLSLHATGGATLCRISHSGFGALPDSAHQHAQYNDGWRSRDVLEKLEELVLNRTG
jgi:uncharacterized protein YndB with AHSA1/START domain